MPAKYTNANNYTKSTCECTSPLHHEPKAHSLWRRVHYISAYFHFPECSVSNTRLLWMFDILCYLRELMASSTQHKVVLHSFIKQKNVQLWIFVFLRSIALCFILLIHIARLGIQCICNWFDSTWDWTHSFGQPTRSFGEQLIQAPPIDLDLIAKGSCAFIIIVLYWKRIFSFLHSLHNKAALVNGCTHEKIGAYFDMTFDVART